MLLEPGIQDFGVNPGIFLSGLAAVGPCSSDSQLFNLACADFVTRMDEKSESLTSMST